MGDTNPVEPLLNVPSIQLILRPGQVYLHYLRGHKRTSITELGKRLDILDLPTKAPVDLYLPLSSRFLKTGLVSVANRRHRHLFQRVRTLIPVLHVLVAQLVPVEAVTVQVEDIFY